MAYWDIASMSGDGDLTLRVQACAAQEIDGDPYEWTRDNMLALAASPGWSEAWASAVAANVERPGKDPGVITDGMILSATQAIGGAADG